MVADVVAEALLQVGTPAVLEGPSPRGHFAAVFEDDGTTGYLYALDRLRPDNPICDALHIYNVADVADRAQPSTFQIIWSVDGLKAALLINNFPYAVFDFTTPRGYCRTGYPPANPAWTAFAHDWDDAALAFFV